MRTLVYTSVVAAFLTAHSAQAQDIPLLVTTSSSGPMVQYDRMIANGAQRAVDDINRNGGVQGRRFSISYMDSSDPLEASKRYMARDGHFIIGFPSSGYMLKMVEIIGITGFKGIFITSSASNPELTSGTSNVIRVADNDARLKYVVSKYIASNFNDARIAVLYGGFYGDAVLDGFDAIPETKGKVFHIGGSGSSGINATEFPDLGAQLESKRIDTIVACFDDSKHLGNILAYLDRMGFKTRNIVCSYGNTPEFRQRMGPLLDGVLVFDQVYNDLEKQSYAAVQVVAKTISAVRFPSVESYIKYMKSGNQFDTAIGVISFDANGDIQPQSASISVYKGGALKKID